MNLRNNDEPLAIRVKVRTKRLLRKREKLSDIITVFMYVRFYGKTIPPLGITFHFKKILNDDDIL